MTTSIHIIRQLKTPHVRQFLRYVAVGVMNTLITLVVIFALKSYTATPLMLCNAIGYAAGLVNSFLWNRSWVFHARGEGSGAGQAIRFIDGYALCYTLQFVFIWATMSWSPFAALLWKIGPLTLSGYGVATIVGMGLYTVANFLYNKFITFGK
ncbi:MAG: GtrA family protein [Muribaculaceae bacterium]|nr:GtrA family protein [Muribaculaceae bacterium]